jgi:drug/metabolite transporter (DMT)-like permease
MQMLAGGLLLVLAGLATGELATFRPAEVSAASVWAVVYLVVAGSLAAFTAYAWLLRNAPTSIVATYAYVNPVVAVALGWLVKAEPVSPRMVAAGAVILGSVALIANGHRRS